MSASTVVFVYGSLKRGQPNHVELGPARFLGESCTEPRYALSVIDGYAALVPGTSAVQGEVFEIPAERLALLDAFEGEGYERIWLELHDGTAAFAYVSRTPTRGVPHSGNEWP